MMTTPPRDFVGTAVASVLFGMTLVLGSAEAKNIVAIAPLRDINLSPDSSIKTSEAAQPLHPETQSPKFPDPSAEKPLSQSSSQSSSQSIDLKSVASAGESEVPIALLTGVVASAVVLVGSMAIFGNKSDDFIIQENISDQEEALTKGKFLSL